MGISKIAIPTKFKHLEEKMINLIGDIENKTIGLLEGHPELISVSAEICLAVTISHLDRLLILAEAAPGFKECLEATLKANNLHISRVPETLKND